MSTYHITIHSGFAQRAIDHGVHDYPTAEWSGDVNLVNCAPGDNIHDVLEHVFRYFNRVDIEDNYRLEDIGYRLPSLSSGDAVTIDGKTFKCAMVGWQEVHPNSFDAGAQGC